MGGICLDSMNPSGRPSADALFTAGADGARLVGFSDPQFFSYCADLAVSMRVVVVLARESFDTDDWAGMGSYYAERCTPWAWCLGNECDAGLLLPVESPSSWKMTSTEYAAFWSEAARGILARQPDARLLTAGLVSGQPSYAYELVTLLDPPAWGFTIHPYGRDAASTRDLLGLYREAVGEDTRFYVGEWHRPAGEMAEYTTMLRTETEWNSFFAWSEGMVPGFGLVDQAGDPRPEYYGFQQAQAGGRQTMSIEEREQQADFPLGNRWGEVVDVAPGSRYAGYDDGLAFELDGAVWEIPIVQSLGKFRTASG